MWVVLNKWGKCHISVYKFLGLLFFFVVGGRHCIVKAKAKYEACSVTVRLGKTMFTSNSVHAHFQLKYTGYSSTELFPRHVLPLHSPEIIPRATSWIILGNFLPELIQS